MSVSNGSTEGLGRSTSRNSLGDAALEVGTQAMEQISCEIFDESSRQIFKEASGNSANGPLPSKFPDGENLLSQLNILNDNANQNYSPRSILAADAVIDKAGALET